MGLRNILVLFFSAMAISLVVLIIFFSLFFEHLDLSFNTRLPETAPSVGDNRPPADGETPSDSFDPFASHEAQLNVPSEAAKITAPPAPYLGAEAELPAGQPPSSATPQTAPTPMQDATEPLADPVPTTLPKVGRPQEAPLPATVRPVPPPTPSAPIPLQRDQAPTPLPKVDVPTPPSNRALYRVYVAGFDTPAEAGAAAQRYSALGLRPVVKTIGGRMIVQLGVYASRDTAQKTAQTAGAAIEVLPQ